MIGSLGRNDSADPFTDGLEILPNFQTISTFEGANRNAGMIWDSTTSGNKEWSDWRGPQPQARTFYFAYSFPAART